MARIFDARGRMAYGIARAMLRDVHEAEDATQQAFLSVYGALLRGARVRDEGAWVAAIVRNECRTRIAEAMRIPPPLADEDLDALAASGDEVERRRQAAALRAALAGLPNRQREAVLLRDLYGLRYGEVATALGLSRPATEALLFRARRALRLRLRPVLGSIFVLPASLRDAIAEAIPGLPALGTGGAAPAGTLGLLAKLGGAPVTAKLATAAVAVTTVGAVGAVETQHARPPSPRASALVSPTSTDDERAQRAEHAFLERESGAREHGRGSGSRVEERGDDRGQGTSGTGDSGSGDDSSSGGGDGRATDDGASSSASGPGPGDAVASGEGSGDSGSSSSGPGPSGSGPTDSSGSSGPSGSSGEGSGEVATSVDQSGESLETVTLETSSSSGSGDGGGTSSSDSGSGSSDSGSVDSRSGSGSGSSGEG